MSTARGGFVGPAALVPGELRGYRQFRLEGDGLYPLVQAALGPWSGGVQQAVCGNGAEHGAPDRDCSCGLYGWYHPDSATGFVDEVSAVVAVRGRSILGEQGFRAAAARIEAVALPWSMWARPGAARRARRMLATRYPHAKRYTSRRKMVRDHPPSDLRELGIDPTPGVARRHMRAALCVWVVALVGFYSAALLLPQGPPAHWGWIAVVIGLVTAQVGAVPLVARLIGDQKGSG
ncbi:hypothetical protein [Rhodococcus sp. X156]|uniref:hypothetical protein n=1 Tax=Rhodococcus sp. X156 TaxID=2499145 RepID=UPI000FDC8324|nr:hypothetical protein [Rhodococcus sp. X156]